MLDVFFLIEVIISFFLFQVQSDKASVTITSRYDGVVKKVHFDVEQVKPGYFFIHN